jgi:hypothetical protein
VSDMVCHVYFGKSFSCHLHTSGRNGTLLLDLVKSSQRVKYKDTKIQTNIQINKES